MLLMSNNQWKCDENKAPWAVRGMDCSAKARVDGLVRAYLQVMPEVIGLQEVSLRMADLMMERMRRVELPDGTVAQYEYISGGDTPIVYRRDKLLLMESGFYRFPEAIPGLEGSFNNHETKSYCYGAFRHRETGETFAALSAHLWWKSFHPESSFYQKDSNKARRYQLLQCCARMDEIAEKYQCPTFLMGDLNASIHSLALEAAFEAGWQEVHDLALGERDDTKGHHPCGPNGFERGVPGSFEDAIDHILLKHGDGVRVEKFCRVNDPWFDRISDHYPLYIEVTF